MRPITLAVLTVAGLACDSATDPTDVPFGVTTFVVVANPVVNDANEATVPTPGGTRNGVTVSVDDGPSGTTTSTGVVVLSPVQPGARILALTGGGSDGNISVTIADQDLREIAVALDGSTAEVMANVRYAFGGEVVELDPSMPLSEVNDALSRSNVIVFLGAGSYSGDLVFSGSNVTLFGEGAQGGSVTLDGNVTVNGSQNRIRGARITGDLTVPGSDFGMSFSRVAGDFVLSGSDATLLNNAFCGTPTISGSGARVIGNAGLAPIGAPAGGC